MYKFAWMLIVLLAMPFSLCSATMFKKVDGIIAVGGNNDKLDSSVKLQGLTSYVIDNKAMIAQGDISFDYNQKLSKASLIVGARGKLHKDQYFGFGGGSSFFLDGSGDKFLIYNGGINYSYANIGFDVSYNFSFSKLTQSGELLLITPNIMVNMDKTLSLKNYLLLSAHFNLAKIELRGSVCLIDDMKISSIDDVCFDCSIDFPIYPKANLACSLSFKNHLGTKSAALNFKYEILSDVPTSQKKLHQRFDFAKNLFFIKEDSKGETKGSYSPTVLLIDVKGNGDFQDFSSKKKDTKVIVYNEDEKYIQLDKELFEEIKQQNKDLSSVDKEADSVTLELFAQAKNINKSNIDINLALLPSDKLLAFSDFQNYLLGSDSALMSEAIRKKTGRARIFIDRENVSPTLEIFRSSKLAGDLLKLLSNMGTKVKNRVPNLQGQKIDLYSYILKKAINKYELNAILAKIELFGIQDLKREADAYIQKLANINQEEVDPFIKKYLIFAVQTTLELINLEKFKEGGALSSITCDFHPFTVPFDSIIDEKMYGICSIKEHELDKPRLFIYSRKEYSRIIPSMEFDGIDDEDKLSVFYDLNLWPLYNYELNKAHTKISLQPKFAGTTSANEKLVGYEAVSGADALQVQISPNKKLLDVYATADPLLGNNQYLIQNTKDIEDKGNVDLESFMTMEELFERNKHKSYFKINYKLPLIT